MIMHVEHRAVAVMLIAAAIAAIAIIATVNAAKVVEVDFTGYGQQHGPHHGGGGRGERVRSAAERIAEHVRAHRQSEDVTDHGGDRYKGPFQQNYPSGGTSYLGLPRMVFSGQFMTDPSTVNNDPKHFDSDSFRASYTEQGVDEDGLQWKGWWWPSGSANWQFREATVQSVTYLDGTSTTSAQVDPIIGTTVGNAPDRAPAKLVDLDPDQQLVSEVWGLKVLVGSAEVGFGLSGEWKVTAFADIDTRVLGCLSDACVGAWFQNVLYNVEFGNLLNTSRYLTELTQSGFAGNLSMKFYVDNYRNKYLDNKFNLGELVGVIGPAASQYDDNVAPNTFINGRFLNEVGMPAYPSPPGRLLPAYVQLNPNASNPTSLTIDLGNSLQHPKQWSNEILDFGPLYLCQCNGSNQPIPIAEIPYRGYGFYPQWAAIYTIPLTAANWALIQSTPICLATVNTVNSNGAPTIWELNPFEVVLAESPTGYWVRADVINLRMNPGDQVLVDMWATLWGAPTVATIAFQQDPTIAQNQVDQGSIGPGPKYMGVPTSGLTFNPTVTTNSAGYASFSIKANNIGNPRKYIDGQMYGVTYGVGSPPPYGSNGNSALQLNILVFSNTSYPSTPSWISHVRPIFNQYYLLYPSMRPIINLASYNNIMLKLETMRRVWRKPITDPNYMPVTRDLSPGKRSMIQSWLDQEVPAYIRFDNQYDLREGIQHAIELEHSTIPPYLTALWSIKQGYNVIVANIINSIVRQEMWHMGMAANLMVAIGGHPRIGHPGFIPLYPGPLPGGLNNLNVRIRKASIEQIRDVFMAIERPTTFAQLNDNSFNGNSPTYTINNTIGWFYSQLRQALITLNSTLNWTTVGQVSYPPYITVIHNLTEALAAIDLITDEGEGVNADNPYSNAPYGNPNGTQLSHYFKFSEIVMGNQLIEDANSPGTFTYDGAPIPFDANGVYDMVDDPDMDNLEPGTRARYLGDQFALGYKNLLQSLHRTWNGEPDTLDAAIGLMFNLGQLARQLMQCPVDGTPGAKMAGPAFQVPFPVPVEGDTAPVTNSQTASV